MEPVTLESPSAVVHVEYDDVLTVPPKPSEGNWTRFVCISDTHHHTFPVPDGDVLLHSGDLTGTGRFHEFEITMKWLYDLPHPIKIIIAGNHDLSLHEDWYEENFERWHRNKEPTERIRSMLTGDDAVKANLVYLENERYKFQSKGGRRWSVFGSPWTPDFYNWAFNYKRQEDEEGGPGSASDMEGDDSETEYKEPEAIDIVERIPKTDILLTHGPPHELLDRTFTKVHAGCEALASALPKLRPRLHVFGHIHEAHGAEIKEWDTGESEGGSGKVENSSGDNAKDKSEAERTVFVNAANEPLPRRGRRHGCPGFRPVVVDLLD